MEERYEGKGRDQEYAFISQRRTKVAEEALEIMLTGKTHFSHSP